MELLEVSSQQVHCTTTTDYCTSTSTSTSTRSGTDYSYRLSVSVATRSVHVQCLGHLSLTLCARREHAGHDQLLITEVR